MARSAVSLFSGAGGLDLGLERAGFLVRLQVESNRWCVQTLEANRQAFRSRRLATLAADVRELGRDELLDAARIRNGRVALLAGGPPCQSFSHAGHRRGLGDSRGSLVAEFLRILRGLEPELFVFENVAGFADSRVADDGGPSRSLLAWFVRECMDAGYAVTWGIADAADYGVPQRRPRFLVLGCRRGCAPAFPPPTHGPRARRRYRTLADALGGLDSTAAHADGGEGLSDLHRRVMAHVPAGGDWRDLPEDVVDEAMGGALESDGGKTGWWRRLAWDRPSPTILGRPTQRATFLCHPDELRALTVRECARIQTFPDSWTFAGQLAPRYRQVGDAVPPKLGEAVGRTMLAHVKGEWAATLDGRPFSARPRFEPGAGRRVIGVWGWAAGEPTVFHGPDPREAGAARVGVAFPTDGLDDRTERGEVDEGRAAAVVGRP